MLPKSLAGNESMLNSTSLPILTNPISEVFMSIIAIKLSFGTIFKIVSVEVATYPSPKGLRS